MTETIIFVLGLVLDRLSKMWISANFVGRSTPVIEGVLDFTYAENTGAAFGIFSDNTFLLSIFSAVMSLVLIAILVFYWKKYSSLTRFSLSMIISGAVGNCIDRFVYGAVVDFIEFKFVNFAIFNIADIFITMGTILLVMAVIFTETDDIVKKKDKDGTQDNG